MTCTLCKIDKPSSEFYRRLETANGLFHQCKRCMRERARSSQPEKTEVYRDEPPTFAEIAKRFHISSSMARLIHDRAIRKLRNALGLNELKKVMR